MIIFPLIYTQKVPGYFILIWIIAFIILPTQRRKSYLTLSNRWFNLSGRMVHTTFFVIDAEKKIRLVFRCGRRYRCFVKPITVFTSAPFHGKTKNIIFCNFPRELNAYNTFVIKVILLVEIIELYFYPPCTTIISRYTHDTMIIMYSLFKYRIVYKLLNA